MLQTLIIFALLSIIPAGIVFLVMWAKIQDQTRKMDMLKRDDDVLDTLAKAQRDLYGSGESIKLELASVKESFQRMSNKLAARARPDRRQEPDQDEPRPHREPDTEPQTLDFPFNVPDRQQLPPAAQQPGKIIMQPKKWRAA
jgi:hypothetical protein